MIDLNATFHFHFILPIENISVDTFPLFVQLVADTPLLHPEIDRLYEKNKNGCLLAASRSPYFQHPLFTAGSIDRQIYAEKYLGLLTEAINQRNSPLFAEAFGIAARHWQSLYCYINDHSEIDLAEIVRPEFHGTAAGKDCWNPHLLAGVTSQYVQSFLALFPSIDTAPQAALKFALFTLCLLNHRPVVQEPEIIAAIQAFGGKTDATGEFQALMKRLNKPEAKKMAKRLKNEIYQRICDDPYRIWANDRFIEGMAHCTAYLSAEEGVSLLNYQVLSNAKERDVELLCRLFIIRMTADWFRYGKCDKTQEEIELECAEFVMLGLNLLELIREYKKAKKYYFAHNAAHLQAELNASKESLAAAEDELRNCRSALTAKTALLARREKEINKLAFQAQLATNDLAKENARLKARIAELEKNQLLLSHAPGNPPAAPRSITPLPLYKSLNTQMDLRRLKLLRAVVIGGAEGWQNKLRSQLPHFDYLYGDANSFDESLIINADMIFANIRCKFNHDFYYKLMRVVRRHQKPMVFLTKTNIALTVRQMANALPTPDYYEKDAVL